MTSSLNMGEKPSSLLKSNDTMTSTEVDGEWHYSYSTVTGYFLQDAEGTHSETFNAMSKNFGLVEQDYDTDELLPANGKNLTQWQRFTHHLNVMNERAAKDVSYRLLYLGRHGQGYHNVGARFYGSEAWDCYYSTLRNDPHVPTVQYFDPQLTLQGRWEAAQVFHFWDQMIKTQKLPVPQSYYCSPHTRAIQTSQITFSKLPLPATAPFKPLIKELLREEYGIHTCDSRSTRTYLQENFPEYRIEQGFTETDELFKPDLRETPRQSPHRLQRLLDDIFEHDDATFISMTSHYGTVAATLVAVGHRPFILPTGGVIPLVVKVEKVKGSRPVDPTLDEFWVGKPDCQSDPLKAGLPGYKDIAEYIKEIEMNVPKDST